MFSLTDSRTKDAVDDFTGKYYTLPAHLLSCGENSQAQTVRAIQALREALGDALDQGVVRSEALKDEIHRVHLPNLLRGQQALAAFHAEPRAHFDRPRLQYLDGDAVLAADMPPEADAAHERLRACARALFEALPDTLRTVTSALARERNEALLSDVPALDGILALSTPLCENANAMREAVALKRRVPSDRGSAGRAGWGERY